MRCLSVFITVALVWIHAHAVDVNTWKVNGSGGGYFLVEPGEFEVDLDIELLNTKARGIFVRAILAAPDRRVLHDQYISVADNNLLLSGRKNVYRLSFKVDAALRGSMLSISRRPVIALAEPLTGLYIRTRKNI